MLACGARAAIFVYAVEMFIAKLEEGNELGPRRKKNVGKERVEGEV